MKSPEARRIPTFSAVESEFLIPPLKMTRSCIEFSRMRHLPSNQPGKTTRLTTRSRDTLWRSVRDDGNQAALECTNCLLGRISTKNDWIKIWQNPLFYTCYNENYKIPTFSTGLVSLLRRFPTFTFRVHVMRCWNFWLGISQNVSGRYRLRS
jgi:hypothetical protein